MGRPIRAFFGWKVGIWGSVAARRAKRPETPCDSRRGLDQRDRSGRIRLRQQRAAREEHALNIVVDDARKTSRAGSRLTRQRNGGCAAQTIATARKIGRGMMMVLRGLSDGMVVCFGAGFGVRGAQMKRSMGVAVDQSKRQQYDQALNPQRPHSARTCPTFIVSDQPLR